MVVRFASILWRTKFSRLQLSAGVWVPTSPVSTAKNASGARFMHHPSIRADQFGETLWATASLRFDTGVGG